MDLVLRVRISSEDSAGLCRRAQKGESGQRDGGVSTMDTEVNVCLSATSGRRTREREETREDCQHGLRGQAEWMGVLTSLLNPSVTWSCVLTPVMDKVLEKRTLRWSLVCSGTITECVLRVHPVQEGRAAGGQEKGRRRR